MHSMEHSKIIFFNSSVQMQEVWEHIEQIKRKYANQHTKV